MVLLVFTSSRFENLSNMKKNKIGLVEIDFPIMSSRDVVDDLNYFKNRNDINAIVVRVDSPGGSVAASQEIYHKIKVPSFVDALYVTLPAGILIKFNLLLFTFSMISIYIISF